MVSVQEPRGSAIGSNRFVSQLERGVKAQFQKGLCGVLQSYGCEKLSYNATTACESNLTVVECCINARSAKSCHSTHF